MQIEANTFGSNYDTTLSAYTGSRGALQQLACNDDSGSVQSQIVFPATAGVTYYFMVGAFASGPGGDLVFTVEAPPPPPPPLELGLTIDSRGFADTLTGVATISGTVTCNRPIDLGIGGQLRQRAGRFLVITGSFGTFTACVPPSTTWKATVLGGSTPFFPGPATADASAGGCDFFGCAGTQSSATVRLNASRR